MKMGPGLIFGLILVAIGLSIIFRLFFNINIFRILFAAIFILIGISILIGKPIFSNKGGDNHVMFGERRINSAPYSGAEYNTIFAKTVYDFRGIDSLAAKNIKISFNTIFGATEILLPSNLPVQIKTDAVFAFAQMPDGNSTAFGTTHFNSRQDEADTPVLIIEADVVFGGLEIKQ